MTFWLGFFLGNISGSFAMFCIMLALAKYADKNEEEHDG
jgi:hypothetical protein